jgi:hypothetical protein
MLQQSVLSARIPQPQFEGTLWRLQHGMMLTNSSTLVMVSDIKCID